MVGSSIKVDWLDVPAALVEAYEAKHYPIGPPSFEAAVDYEMEKWGMTRANQERAEAQNRKRTEMQKYDWLRLKA